MKSNLWPQINKIVYESHIFGVHEQKNFQKSVNVYEIQFMVPNKRNCLFAKEIGGK